VTVGFIGFKDDGADLGVDDRPELDSELLLGLRGGRRLGGSRRSDLPKR
jgi:hypothetical protein